MTTLNADRPTDWEELDAIVGAELDLLLARRSRPVVEPEVSEVQFMDMAVAFLLGHSDPSRLIAELERRVAPIRTEPSPVAQEKPQEDDAGRQADPHPRDPLPDHHDEGDVP